MNSTTRRRSSQEDSLLIYPQITQNEPQNFTKYLVKNSIKFALLGFMIFVTILLVSLSISTHASSKKNVILMVSDGFGPASETLARNYYQRVNNLPLNFKMPLDTILIGQSRTRSSNSLVTDSAAGATAFSCAMKTFNGAIGVDPMKKSCGTVLEAAKLNGFATGLVVTSRITHATPASFAAHVGNFKLT